MGDLWIKAVYPLGPFPEPPLAQAVADVLANAPLRHGRLAFQYEHVDRPEAGTALLALATPPTRAAPPDGLRYLYAEPSEHRQVSTHTIAIPTSFHTPNQSHRVQVELECFTAMAGHLPPMHASQPLQPGSPEMALTRYRKRWRITNGSYPGLWFYYWGQDASGGTGQPAPPAAPATWANAPARQYPLVKPPGVPSGPVFPFPDPASARPPQAQAAAPATQGGLTAAQVQQLAAAGNPYARQQQLAALQSATPLAMGASNPALEARQQQFQAQMAGQQQYAYGMTPQMQAAQMQAQQAQMLAAQQQRMAAAAAATPIAPAPARAPPPQRKPAPPPTASSSSAAAAPSGSQVAPIPPAFEDETPLADILDLVTPRQLASHRYAKQHDLLAPLFDGWSASAILAGGPRKREVDELVQTNGISGRTGEVRMGVVPGLQRDGPLATLGCTAARIAVFEGLGKAPEKATLGLSVEERKRKLEKMLSGLQQETQETERQHKEKVAKVRKATAGGAVVV
ncbi:hypothetical protein JCM10213_001297 [Rhodosporidiobolus nylandii]